VRFGHLCGITARFPVFPFSGILNIRFRIPMLRSLLFFAISTVAALGAPADSRPNVLLILSDDLATTLGCYGYPQAKTPQLDALAKRGVRFDRAYCQFPHCNPSRASFLSGLRPNTTRVTLNGDNLYDNLPGVVTLPAFFRQQGYATARCGKIFHLGVPAGTESRDDPKAWDFGTPFKDERPYPPARESVVKVKTAKKQGLPWQEIPVADDDLVDGNFAREAIGWLERRDQTKPFFLAVGFHRPHLPFAAPAKYFDLYPFDTIKLPPEPADDEADIPLPARNESVNQYAMTATPDQRRAAIRAYLATVSFMDAQAGRVLDALKRLGVADNTIVVFSGDHGWHLGEHGLWHKRSLFEQSARVPFIIHAPGAKGNGQVSASVVELLDIYPTLCDLAGLPAPKVLQGRSLRPVLNDPRATMNDMAFTQARRGPDAANWGRSVRTPRWRCTEWDEGRNGIELYDHDADPGEFTNLANDPRHATVLKDLRTLLAERVPAQR
jgi:choline-sulfatase